ncbi:hypothetical protein [Staphylococcus phage PT94]
MNERKHLTQTVIAGYSAEDAEASKLILKETVNKLMPSYSVVSVEIDLEKGLLKVVGQHEDYLKNVE